MTTLRKLINQVNIETKPSWEKLANEFGISLNWTEDTRLKCYFIERWYCTDSCVGTRVYFLDNEFVCISYQSGRKMNENFYFVSKEIANKVGEYLKSLVEIEYNVDIIEENFLDEVIPDEYTIEYNSQIIQKQGYLNGQLVEIVKCYYPYSDKDRHFHTVEIKLPSGEIKEIHCRELKFKYNT